VAVAVGGGSEQAQDMIKGKQMSSKALGIASRNILPLLLTAIASVLVGLSQAAPDPKQMASDSPQLVQEGFATPKQAADALIQASAGFDVVALKKILGPDGQDLVTSEDPVQDKKQAAAFAAAAQEKNSVTISPKNPNRATVVVGNGDWPLPIPIVKRNGKWYFDPKSGKEEILLQRIGANELDAIQICRGFVEAQHEYAVEQHDDSGVNQYAQRIISTPGKHDGLAWRNSDGSWGGPVGESVAKALEQGYSDRGQPFHGYYFKALKGQGPAARMGQMDFVVNGVMIGGFALAAAPAQYRVTGVQTFIVNQDGVVYQKDLGPDTITVFKNMERYDPDKSWHRTDDNW
jgi:hypothetical protein